MALKEESISDLIKNLDRIDQHILQILKNNGRISYQKLAELIHLTPRPTQERVRKLERSGIITGYSADIAKVEPVRQGVVLQLQVALKSQSGRAAQEAFELAIQQRADVLSCWLISGPFDYVLRLNCPDMDAYRVISNEWLNNPQFKIEKIVSTPEMQVIK